MKIEFKKDENPRWTMCHAALGDKFPPEEVKPGQLPRGIVFQFWMQARWKDYAEFVGAPHIPHIGNGDRVFLYLWDTQRISLEQAQNMFNQWLKQEVEAGKYKEIP